jgi:hypothetical protein
MFVDGRQRKHIELRHILPLRFAMDWIRNVSLLALAIAFLQHPSEAAEREVRGEPIRGKPITKPAKTNSSPIQATIATNAPPSAPQKQTDTEFQTVRFDLLANFTFEVPDGLVSTNDAGKSNTQIPADVRVLNDKKVALKGFMLPLKVDNGLVTEMLIMKDQSMCCYGTIPRINDWVSVKMKGKGVPSVMDQPVTVFGKLAVGEMLENGYLVGIYQMDGERMNTE